MEKGCYPPLAVCLCVCVCINPYDRKSAGNGGTSTAVFTFKFQQKYLLHSKQIYGIMKGGISYASEKEIGNVNIIHQTNIFVCGLLFKGMTIYANIIIFRMSGDWLCERVVRKLLQHVHVVSLQQEIRSGTP